MDYQLLDPETILRKMGRGRVFFATATAAAADRDPIRWDRDQELFLKHLGETEGDVVYTPNSTEATLTLPEESGGMPLEVAHLGYAPTLDLPLFLVDPDLYPIVNERGQSSGGNVQVCDVTDFTVVIFSQNLFQDADCSFKVLSYTTVGGWKLDGVELTPAQLTKLEVTLWLWRVYAKQSNIDFKGAYGDEGKNIAAVQFVSVSHSLMPDGHKLWTRGDPNTYGIDMEGGS